MITRKGERIRHGSHEHEQNGKHDLGLKGWSDTEIVKHILYIVTGEENCKAKEKAD